MGKSPDAFRTISEVATDLDLPQHVLRFWETRFTTIRPLKRGGGRRYYRPDDVDLLRGIRSLLYGQGYTIKGVQRILREDGPRTVQAIGRGDGNLAALPRPAAADDDEDDVEGTPREVLAAEGPEPERLPGAIIPDPRPGASSGFAGDEIARLRVALDELVECERVLTALREE